MATNAAGLPNATRIVSNCLVRLDVDDAPEFQYGYFTNPAPILVAFGANNYIAAQGTNLAGLLTPQSERAFDVPVDSATVVAVLTNINFHEAVTNVCHTNAVLTRWTTEINEWVNVTNNTFTLNFFPVDPPDPNANDAVFDPWTEANYNDWTYDEIDRTFTLDDTNAAPSQLLIVYDAYLGCQNQFTNSYGGPVPALEDDTLAGVALTTDLLSEMRGALEAVLPNYVNTATNSWCVPWTKTTILSAVWGTNTTEWLPLTNGGLIETNHFAELQSVLNLLTNADNCSCICPMIVVTNLLFTGCATNQTIQITATNNYCYSLSFSDTWIGSNITNACGSTNISIQVQQNVSLTGDDRHGSIIIGCRTIAVTQKADIWRVAGCGILCDDCSNTECGTLYLPFFPTNHNSVHWSCTNCPSVELVNSCGGCVGAEDSHCAALSTNSTITVTEQCELGTNTVWQWLPGECPP